MTHQAKDTAVLRSALMMGSRQIDKRTGGGNRPAFNNLIGAAVNGTGSEVALAAGNLATQEVSKIGMTVRNTQLQPNSNNGLTRSWTRHISSAGGPQMELPYPGHLPTLGLLKRKGKHNNNVHEISEFESQIPPRHSNIHKSNKSRRRGYDFYENAEQSTTQDNPYGREGNTEKLLLAREKEREHKELTKGDLEGLRVFEKQITIRQNRSGVIRDINGIRELNKHDLDKLRVFEKSINNRPSVVREIQGILAQNKYNPDLQSSN